MFCPACGNTNPDGAHFCTKCGKSLDGTPQPAAAPATARAGTRDNQNTSLVYPKNPPLSPHLCWLQLVCPGVAHLVFGQIAKGIVIFLAVVLISTLIPVIGILASYGLAITDAYLVGAALKKGKPVGKWQFFPS